VPLGAEVALWDGVPELLVECAPPAVASPVGVWRTGVGSGGALTNGVVTLGVVTRGVEVVPTVIDGVVTPGTVTVGTEMVGTDTVGTRTVGTDTAGTDTVGTDTVGTDTVGTDTVGMLRAAVDDAARMSSAPHVTSTAGTKRRARANRRMGEGTGHRSPPDPSATEVLDIALPTAHRSSLLALRARVLRVHHAGPRSADLAARTPGPR
jgi:hypothetical protein